MRVRDSGLGIPELDIPNLSQRFYRIARPECEDIRSTGRDVYRVRQYIEHMGGSVGAERVDGAGSTFHFMVPLDQSVEQKPAIQHPEGLAA